ncbi:ATP-binding protein [Photobacterium lutimaris]|uniref:Histidine kinase n=1 Tax=Photobacterium lutimaris TaxID=388278 RepID=A0A2T3IU04_9GAMM|nr:sensor histidine kinase [Photobacterium lutimaris]PSU31838.1 histidine kinase [Photobacterium lutimaris]TDR73360.1 signal transduction histidine kinase [Photobacterium lutimaris]
MAYTSSTFKTRARTIDHLGREQIADCPTAISELWKNSFDAYATDVSLHLFDGDTDVAALLDNGHGMSRQEFEEKWLTVGTESKTDGFEIKQADRNGLKHRAKQGQKGIGRLSSAALGPLLLLVSKRKNDRFVAALIDWRLFENPYIYLDDIRIPITEFDNCADVLEELPTMFDKLLGNLWGDSEAEIQAEASALAFVEKISEEEALTITKAVSKARTSRLAAAWEQYSGLELGNGISIKETTKSKIENTLIKEVFSERHLGKWAVWQEKSEQGTAMFTAELSEDLKAQLSSTPYEEAGETDVGYKENFFQTLSNFVDPFSKKNEPQTDRFSCSVTVWRGIYPDTILGQDRQFDLANLEDLEHVVEGYVDSEGYFRGRVKVFGEWIEDYIVKPKQIYKTRKDSAFGPFHLRAGTFEMQIGSTSLSDEQHASFVEQAEKYAGFRVYRDGLRVMPYGRADNDYFRIEERRSKSAGRYFWSNRRMFGRIAITRENNPNLKDKAGREGFIENRASKLFKEIVEKILIDVADEHFGGKAENRKPTLEFIREQKALQKAEDDRKKLLSRERKRIRTAIKKNTSSLVEHLEKLSSLKHSFESRIKLNSVDELQKLKKEADALSESTQNFSLSPVPPNLGRLEDDYRYYRKHELAAKEIVQQLTVVVNKALEESSQKTDFEKANEVYRSKLTSLNNAINRYATRGKEALTKQVSDFDRIVKQCRDQYKLEVEDALEDLKLEKISLGKVLTILDETQLKVDVENRQKLGPYTTALESLEEQIDLEGLALHSMNESIKYREELVRLHSLAQLGITVEIVGHEMESLDRSVDFGLKSLADTQLSTDQNEHLRRVDEAHQALMEKLRFLSPLKLSGEKVSRKISGKEICNYVQAYFGEQFERAEVTFTATKSFESITIVDMASRIFPVFINLVNNSLYWVQQHDAERKITLDIIDDEVVVSDDGPGVDIDDLEQLFTLFFTRKQRGGRGVGLYLSKQNLNASGHKIRYETRDRYKVHAGANFAIEFKGMKNE